MDRHRPTAGSTPHGVGNPAQRTNPRPNRAHVAADSLRHPPSAGASPATSGPSGAPPRRMGASRAIGGGRRRETRRGPRVVSYTRPPLTPPVSIIGATGALGFGLAVRWGRAGVPVVIASRDAAPAG